MISDYGAEWISFLVHAGGGGFNTDGGTEFEGAEHRIEVMAGNVAERAGPEVPPAPPLGREVSRVIGPGRSRPQPEIPLERVRHGGRFGRTSHSLGPVFIEESARWAIRPDMHFAHRADGVVEKKLLKPARLLGGLSLVSHLGSDFRRAGSLGHFARLPHGMGERLF